jgi:hypothetical protein
MPSQPQPTPTRINLHQQFIEYEQLIIPALLYLLANLDEDSELERDCYWKKSCSEMKNLSD